MLSRWEDDGTRIVTDLVGLVSGVSRMRQLFGSIGKHVGRKAGGGLDGGLCLGRQIRMFIFGFFLFPFEYGDGENWAVPN